MSETNRCEGPSRSPVYYEDEPSEPLGAQCKNASSDASKLATQTNDDAQMRDYLHTKAVDPPLQDDVIGNMIPGALVGGAGAGVARGAVTSSLRSMAATAAAHTAKDIAKDAAKHALVVSVKTSVDVTTLDAPAAVSKGAASVPVKEPLESKPEPEKPAVGQDRSPYAPGYAPLRIPEAPTIIRG
jgi:hypothetical protein